MTQGALGSLVVSLEANIAQFEAAMTRAEHVANQMSRGVTASVGKVDAAIAGFVGGAANKVLDGLSAAIEQLGPAAIASAAQLERMRQTIGGTIENLSAMASVAKLSGTPVESLQNGMAKLAKSMAGAGDESKGAGAALAAIGVSARNAQGVLRPTDEVMIEIAGSLAKFADGAGKAAVAQALFGKAGAQLLPMLHDMAIAGDMVGKVTAEQARQAEEYEKNIKRLEASKQALVRTIALEVVPVLDVLASAFVRAQKESGGLRGEVNALAKDGSIRGWAEETVAGLGFFVDAARGVVTAFQLIGQTIGAAAAQFAAYGRVAAGVLEIQKGNVSGGLAMIRENLAAVTRIGRDWVGTMDGLLQAPANRVQQLIDRMFEARRIAEKYSGGQFLDARDLRLTGPKPQLPYDPSKVVDDTHRIEAAQRALNEVYAKAVGIDSAYFGQFEKLTLLYNKGLLPLDDYRAAVSAALMTHSEYGKELAKTGDQMRELYIQYEQAKKSADFMVRGIEEEIAALKLGNTEREIAIKLHQLERQGIRQGSKDYEDFALRIRAAVTERQGLKDMLAFWDDLSTRAGNFFSDLVMNGASAFARLRDEMKRFLAELLAIFAKRWVLQMVAGLTGSTALGAAAGQVGQGTIGGAISSALGSYLGSTALGGAASGALSSFALGLQGGTMTGGTAIMQGANAFGAAINGAAGALGIFAIAIVGAAVAAGQYARGWSINTTGNRANQFNGADPTWFNSQTDRAFRGLGINDQWAAILSGSSVTARIFGHQAPQTDAAGVRGTVGLGAVTGENWRDWTSKGGWFSSDRHGSDTAPLSTDQSSYFAQMMASINATINAFAGNVGVNSSTALAGYGHDFKLDFNGKSNDDIQTMLGDLFGAVLQEQTSKLFDSAGRGKLADYVRGLQGASADVAASIGELLAVMQGATALNAKGLSAEALMAWQQKGESLSQTFQRVATQFAQFDDAFTSDAEKLARTQQFMTAAFSDLGVVVPASTHDFYELVHGLDLSSESGRHMFDVLMTVAPAFQTVTQAAANALSQFYQLAGGLSSSFGQEYAKANLDAAAQKWLSIEPRWASENGWTVDKVINEIGGLISGGTSSNPGGFSSALTYVQSLGGDAMNIFNSLLSAYSSWKSAMSSGGVPNIPAPVISNIADLGNAAAAAADAMRSAREGITDWLSKTMLSDQLSTLSPAAKLDLAHNQYIENLMAAQKGDVGALSKYTGMADTYLQLARGFYASGSDYQSIFAGVTNQAAGLAGLADASRPLTALDFRGGVAELVKAIRDLQASTVIGQTDIMKVTGQATKAAAASSVQISQAINDGALTFK